MDSHTEIIKEWDALQPSFSRSAGGCIYALPDDFFKHFPNQILEEIRLGSITEQWPKPVPFDLPGNYFDVFSDNLKEKLFQIPAKEEIASLSPLLASLKDKQTFALPSEGFFEQVELPAPEIAPLEADHYRAELRIRRMHWVAAAAILCIFFLGGLNFWGGVTDSAGMTEQSIQSALANIPDADIQSYLNNNTGTYDLYSSVSTQSVSGNISSDEERLFKGISDKDIEEALENQVY